MRSKATGSTGHVVKLHSNENRSEGIRHGSMLITTKIRAPLLRSKIVHRTQLVDRISVNQSCRLVLISGMAGSGKTSLVCQWIAQVKPLVAWYSLDSMDDDTDLFFRYLLFALSDLHKGLSSALAPLLQDKRGLLGKEVVASVIEALVDVTEDVYLVIDDYHLITSREIHDALSYFLSHMPPQMHVIFISRKELPFPISHFKVRNQMIEISALDLKFTEKETTAFFTEVMPINLSEDQIHQMGKQTDGWVGGLQLLGLSLQGEEDIHNLKDIMGKTRDEAADYLMNEVIDTQHEDVKTFLYATSLLDRFNIQVCQAVTGLENVSEILDHLYRNNLFLIALDNERIWYRYNHLFADVIRSRIGLMSWNIFCQVHQKAALWFSENGCLEDAFRHAFASEDIEFAADLLEDYVQILFERHDNVYGLRWLGKLPYNIFMQRPLLRLYECILKIESYDLIDIQAFMEDIEKEPRLTFDRYDSSKKRRCKDLLIYLKYVFPYYRDRENGNMIQLEEALQKISPEDKFITCLIKDAMTVHHLFQGNPASAVDLLKESMPSVFALESLWNKLDCFKSLAFAERWQGHLRQSENVVQKAFRVLDQQKLSDSPMKSILYLPLAWGHYFRNDLDNALECATVAMRYMERTGYLKDFVNASWVISFIHIARNEREKAEQYIKNLSETVRLAGHTNLINLADAVLACLALAQGNFRWALQWADQIQPLSEQPFSYRLTWEGIALGEILYRQGKYREAVNMLEELRSRCVEKNMLETVLSLDLLYAASLYAIDEYPRAKRIIERALSFSETEGYIRQFINYRTILTPLLRKLIGSMCEGKISNHTLKIMQAFGINTNSTVIYNGPESLTAREMEILKFLVAGYKYREIADKTFVSFETVKSHIKNIYDKMNVSSKTQAIELARDWKILCPSPGTQCIDCTECATA